VLISGKSPDASPHWYPDTCPWVNTVCPIDHQQHIDAGHMQGPENTLPMMGGQGLFGPMEMGGMFTLIKVRDQLDGGADPGWYQPPDGTQAYKVDTAPDDLPV